MIEKKIDRYLTESPGLDFIIKCKNRQELAMICDKLGIKRTDMITFNKFNTALKKTVDDLIDDAMSMEDYHDWKG